VICCQDRKCKGRFGQLVSWYTTCDSVPLMARTQKRFGPSCSSVLSTMQEAGMFSSATPPDSSKINLRCTTLIQRVLPRY
jgi:hypothetical protein